MDNADVSYNTVRISRAVQNGMLFHWSVCRHNDIQRRRPSQAVCWHAMLQKQRQNQWDRQEDEQNLQGYSGSGKGRHALEDDVVYNLYPTLLM